MLKVTFRGWVVMVLLAYPCCRPGAPASGATERESPPAQTAAAPTTSTSSVVVREADPETQLQALWRLLDLRKSTVEPRARALVVTELQGLTRTLKATPLSVNVPLSYFTFGELFRLEAATDRSRISLAMAAFKEVTKDSSPQNRVRCLAQERLARYGAAPGALQSALLYDEGAACARFPVEAAPPGDAFSE